MRQRRADDLNRAGEIGRDLPVDLLVGHLFACAEQTITRIAHNDIDTARGFERPGNARPDRPGMGDIERQYVKAVVVLLLEVVERAIAAAFTESQPYGGFVALYDDGPKLYGTRQDFGIQFAVSL